MAGQRCAATSPYATVCSTSAGGTLVEVSPGACTRSAAARARAGDPNVDIVKLDLSREGTMALYVDAAGVVRQAGGHNLPWLGRSPSDGPVLLAVGEHGIVPTGLLEMGLPPGRSLKYPLGSDGRPRYMATALQARGVDGVRAVPTLTGDALSVSTLAGAARRGPARFTVGDGEKARSYTVLPASRRPPGGAQGRAAQAAALAAAERVQQAKMDVALAEAERARRSKIEADQYEDAYAAAEKKLVEKIERPDAASGWQRHRDLSSDSFAELKDDSRKLLLRAGFDGLLTVARVATPWGIAATAGMAIWDGVHGFRNAKTGKEQLAAAGNLAIVGLVAGLKISLTTVGGPVGVAAAAVVDVHDFAGRSIRSSYKRSHEEAREEARKEGRKEALAMGLDPAPEATANRVLQSFCADLAGEGPERLERPEITAFLGRMRVDPRLIKMLAYPDTRMDLRHQVVQSTLAGRRPT